MSIPEATLLLLFSYPNLDTKATDANGNTIAHLFASSFCGNDSKNLCETLLQKPGASEVLNQKNRQGMTPLHKSATNYTCGDIVAKVLIEKGSDLNIQDQDGHVTQSNHIFLISPLYIFIIYNN